MSAACLLVGRHGFVARAIGKAAADGQLRAVAHGELGRSDLLDGIDCVLACAKHPAIHGDDYDLERDDPDVRLARQIGERAIRYLMLSTRKVYAPGSLVLDETSPLAPSDAYGRNKLKSEVRLRELLGDRLTV
ncbi:MAG: NAD(P)-dependent oxidoreductase, partial [Geminicoccaceae bacterium]|nr:NAD(P)-dependent oxidoreductase [Geminicoccaceae bacterium]